MRWRYVVVHVTKRGAVFGTAVLASAALGAAPFSAVVVPNEFENHTTGYLAEPILFRTAGGVRSQIIIRQSELSGVAIGSRIRGIRFRAGDPIPGTIQSSNFYPFGNVYHNQLRVWLGQTGKLATALDPKFSLNYPKDRTQVRGTLTQFNTFVTQAGTLDLSDTLGEFGPVIWFDAPYTYKGGNLYIELSHTGADASASDPFLPYEPAPYDKVYGGIFAYSATAGTAVSAFRVPVVQIVAQPRENTKGQWGKQLKEYDPATTQYKQVSIYTDFGAGLRADGSIGLFGSTDSQTSQVPTGPFSRISVGHRFGVALRLDGSLAAWGHSESGQTQIPSGQFVAVETGPDFGLALRPNRKAVYWGPTKNGVQNVPDVRFRQVACGQSFAIGLKLDGSLIAWGIQPSGSTVFSLPSGPFTAVYAHADYAAAIRSDGSVVCWGTKRFNLNEPPAGLIAEELDLGPNHVAAKNKQKHAVVWGSTSSGEDEVPKDPISEIEAFDSGCMAVMSAEATSVDGAIEFDGFAADPSTIPVHVNFRNATDVGDGDFSVNNTGTFSLLSPVPDGTYDIQFTAPKYLSHTEPGSNVNNTGTFLKFTMYAGDVDGDNAVTVFDYLEMSNCFDTSKGDAKYNDMCDFDGDESITIFDYLILSRNFDKVGD
ncbi:MAG: hypothetical protein JST40_03010 [Armatimonadetes bacterium]|nr:hypothetical protein [Armatimonadota bacterium]